MVESTKKIDRSLRAFIGVFGAITVCLLISIGVLFLQGTPASPTATRESHKATSARELALESWPVALGFTESEKAKKLQVQFALAKNPSRWSNIVCAEKVDDPNTRGMLVTSALHALPWKPAKEAETLGISSKPGGSITTELLEIETVIHDHVARLNFRLKEE